MLIDAKGETVSAFYPISDNPESPANARVLSDFLRISKWQDSGRRTAAIRYFVVQHGLLNSPFTHSRSGRQVGEAFIYKEELEDYQSLSEVLASTIRINTAISGKSKVTPIDVKRVAEFLASGIGVGSTVRIARQLPSYNMTKLWNRFDEPLPHEHRGKQGDLRLAWRALQGQRALEVLDIWMSKGGVRPRIVREGTRIRADQWTGATWGALAGALQDAIVGRGRLGVCYFCGTTYQGASKRPRRSYRGKRVQLCCGDPDCKKSKSRKDTAKSRRAGRAK